MNTMKTDAPSETVSSFANDYKLPRDDLENLRLTSQHFVFVRRQGWLIHPKISDALSKIENPQIADVACGTAIWGFQAASEHPNSTVTGLDISDVQFPPRWTWPSNATLGLLDLSKSIPQEHQAKYDLVHCRLLLQAGPNIDPRIWIRGFESLLKPGGWIQWEEPGNPCFMRVSRTDHQTTLYEMPAVDNIMQLKSKAGWFRDFEVWMRENSNLQDLTKIQPPIHLGTMKLENDVIRRVSLDVNNRMQQLTDLDQSLREQIHDECIGQLHQMNSEGDLAAFNWFVGLARAP